MIILLGISVSLLVFLAFFWVFSKTNRSLEKQKTAALQVSPSHEKAFTISSKDIENDCGV